MTPKERRLRYERLKYLIPNLVRKTIKANQNEVIQGERAVEIQVPDKYRKEPSTQDYDVYSNVPKQSAEETERELDRKFDGDYFRVEPAKHKGTYKVVSNIDDDGWADYTKPDIKKVPKVKIGNSYYTTLEFELAKAKRTLAQKKYAYRHEKEMNKIKRINATLALRQSMNQSIGKKKPKRMQWV